MSLEASYTPTLSIARRAVARNFLRKTGHTDLAGYSSPVGFLREQMVIADSPDGKFYMHPEIERVLNVMFARNADHTLKYQTMLWSSIKKSGKTALAAGVALWQAYTEPDGEIYIVGNDLKQADNRMNQAIRYCLQHNPLMGDVRIKVNTAYLPNGTRIEAVPVDPAGEAGSNPTGIFWTEVWGAKQKKHEEMWSEMALSPTRQGRSFKMLESYAGHSGESVILERLYNAVVRDRQPLDPDVSPELYADGGTIAYWNKRRYLPWQQGALADQYYANEEREKTPAEFRRQHSNEWADSTNKFVPLEWWDSCYEPNMPELQSGEVWVIGLDAAVSNDCFAMLGVTRRDDLIYVRYCGVWSPPIGADIDYEKPKASLDSLITMFPIQLVTYDETQLHYFMQAYAGIVWTEKFSQGNERLIGDKVLYDLIRERKIRHDGNPTLRAHIDNADAETDKHGSKLRIVKRQAEKKIDAAVALAMAAHRARQLNIG